MSRNYDNCEIGGTSRARLAPIIYCDKNPDIVVTVVETPESYLGGPGFLLDPEAICPVQDSSWFFVVLCPGKCWDSTKKQT